MNFNNKTNIILNLNILFQSLMLIIDFYKLLNQNKFLMIDNEFNLIFNIISIIFLFFINKILHNNIKKFKLKQCKEILKFWILIFLIFKYIDYNIYSYKNLFEYIWKKNFFRNFLFLIRILLIDIIFAKRINYYNKIKI